MKTKYCYCCRICKPVQKFNKNKSKKDGLADECKNCKHIQDKKYYNKNKNRLKQYSNDYYYAHHDKCLVACKCYSKSIKGKEVHNRGSAKYIKNNPEKYAAHCKVYCALSTGELQKPKKCQVCNIKGYVEAHHEDYSKPLDIIWVCKKCHCIYHKRA